MKEKRGINPLEKRWGIGCFSDVNRIGRPKTITSIPILLGHYRQLPYLQTRMTTLISSKAPKNHGWEYGQGDLKRIC